MTAAAGPRHLFADITDAGFDLLTYRKNDTGKDIPDLPGTAFAMASCTGDDGREHAYDLADTTTDLTVTEGEHKGRVLTLRQVTRRKPGDTRQVHILTTRAGRGPARRRRHLPDDLPVAGGELLPLRPRPLRPRRPGLLRRHPRRPRPDGPEPGEENRRRRGQDREENPRQPPRPPARTSSPPCAAPPPGPAPSSPTRSLARLDAPVTAARRDLDAAQAAARAIPAKIPLAEHNPAMVKLDTETKLITHAIRMAACNTETILARALNGRYARAGDEAYALIREALHASGDITIYGSTLHIRLDPLSAPRRTRALAALCEQLSTTRTRYPGTHLALRYEVKEHPGTA